MSLKTAASLLAVTIALGVAPHGLAQTPPAPTTKQAPPPEAPVAGQIIEQDANTILASRDLIGQSVYAPDNTTIGAISDLILSEDGKTVEAFVIGVGGFLGLGEKKVALKMDRLNTRSGPDGAKQLTMDMSKEELSNAPRFKSKRDLETEKAAEQRPTDPPMQRPMTPKQ